MTRLRTLLSFALVVMVPTSGLLGCASTMVSNIANSHNTLGAAQLERGDVDSAESRFRVALEYQPHFAEAHANLAMVALLRGDLRLCERRAGIALRLDPDLSQGANTLGVCLERQNRMRDAIAAYERALLANPGQAAARLNLSRVLILERRYREARAHLLRLREIAPSRDAKALLAAAEQASGLPTESPPESPHRRR